MMKIRERIWDAPARVWPWMVGATRPPGWPRNAPNAAAWLAVVISIWAAYGLLPTDRGWSSGHAGERVVMEHPSAVLGVVVESTGQRLISWDLSGQVYRNDLDSGLCERIAHVESGLVTCACYASGRGRLITCEASGVMERWDVETMAATPLGGVKEGPVLAIAVTPDGRCIAASQGDEVTLFDGETGAARGRLQGHSGRVTALAFSPDGRMVASGGADAIGRVWDVETGECEHLMPGHRGSIKMMTFSEDGRRLATVGSMDGEVRLWDAATGELVHCFQGPPHGARAVAFSGDGMILATGHGNGEVMLWNLIDYQGRRVATGHSGDVNGLAFMKDGRGFITGGGDSQVRLHEAGR